MTISKSVERLFTIHGVLGSDAQRARAGLYVEELVASGICVQCIEAAIETAVHESKRLPDWPELRDAAGRQTNRADHALHLAKTDLADDEENWWRVEAVKLIGPKVDGDKMLAAYIAAAMWGVDVPAHLDYVADELETYSAIWIDASRTFLASATSRERTVQWAFQKARWIHEHHPSEQMPAEFLEVPV